MSSAARAGQRVMGSLHYASITSLDGYVADRNGSFDWSVPDEEVHRFVNDLQRQIRTHLYGRRLYEVMVAWETLPTEDEPAVMADFAAIWRAADKIVYSTTLSAPSSACTRIEHRFDPAMVRNLKAATAGDLLVGRSPPGGPGAAGRSRRRDPAAGLTGRRGWRDPLPARGPDARARARRRAQVRQRRGAPGVPGARRRRGRPGCGQTLSGSRRCCSEPASAATRRVRRVTTPRPATVTSRIKV